MRGLRVGAGERCEHALIFRPLDRGGADQAVEVVREAAGAVEILHQAALPGRREIERGDQRGEQPDIAHADFRRRDAVMRGRLEAEREHLGVGRGGVAPPERLDARLQEFGRRLAAMAEHRPEIADSRPPRPPRARRDSRATPEW